MRILTPYEQWLLTNGSLLFRSTGPNPILSHFYLCNIKINEFEYSSVEQAYQFFKVKNIFKDDENG
uniref:Uncharacterized protein n=1 Tax=Romanomermis culicivorax TaxID=13658 RepID=A0A915KEN4_ROMCU